MRRRRCVGNSGRAMTRQPIRAKEEKISKAYIPNVRPFMRQFGYSEGLEEILREIEGMPDRNHFYYEQGDLWREKR